MCALEDELIREVTINCAERGLLLLRVRDEIRMTIAAYQTLYESSVAFGMRKALQAEQGKSDMERKVSGVYTSLGPYDSSVSGPHGCHSGTKFWPPRVLSITSVRTLGSECKGQPGHGRVVSSWMYHARH